MKSQDTGAFTERLLDYLLNNTDIGVASLDLDHKILSANMAMAYLSGMPSERLVGTDLLDVVAPSSRTEFLRRWEEDPPSGKGIELNILSSSGLYHHCRFWLWEHGLARMALFQEEELAARLAEISVGQGSEESFYEQLNLELYRSQRYKRPLSVLKCQLDDIQGVVGTFGEGAGSRAMALAGWRLRKMTRRSDIVARISAEQYGILLPETSLAGALSVAEKLSQSIRDIDIETSSGILKPTASFGVVAVSESTPADPAFVLKAVDWALSIARSRGPSAVEVAPSVALPDVA